MKLHRSTEALTHQDAPYLGESSLFDSNNELIEIIIQDVSKRPPPSRAQVAQPWVKSMIAG